MYADYELNSTTTPLTYNGTDKYLNSYINSSCNSTYCMIPVSYFLGSGGLLQISDLNVTQDINPIRLTTSVIQDLDTITIEPTYTDGLIQFDDIKFDYRGRKNITVSVSGINLTIQVMYSPFNVTILPQGINYWSISPNIHETITWVQNNIPPFGNGDGDGNPFWNITRRIWDSPIDIYVRYNESVNTCQTTWFNGINESDDSTLPVTLNTSAQLLVSNLESNQANISTYTNISCSAYNSTLIVPWVCWSSLCSDCVLTSNYDSNCEWLT